MFNNDSSEFREWAARCEDMASTTTDATERASLLRKCEALRALADSEDWLTGMPSGSPATLAKGQVFDSGDRVQAVFVRPERS